MERAHSPDGAVRHDDVPDSVLSPFRQLGQIEARGKNTTGPNEPHSKCMDLIGGGEEVKPEDSSPSTATASDSGMSTSSHSGSTALTELLDGLEIAEFSKFSRMLATCTEWSLLNSLAFCRGLYLAIKEADFEDPDSQKLVISMLAFVRSAVHISQSCSLVPVMHILDFVVIRAKSMDATKHTTFVITVLDNLFAIFQRQNQLKRLKNISNLLFHFGGKLVSLNKPSAARYWRLCVDVEEEMAVELRVSDSKTMRTKCERIANLLLTSGSYDDAAFFLSKVFATFKRPESVLDCEVQLRNQLPIPLKLFSKLILVSKNPEIIVKATELEPYLVVIASEIVKILTGYPKLVSKIILILKNLLHDNALFLYFLSRISFTIEFSMTFKAMGDLSFENSSAVAPLQDLIKAHIYLLQAYSSPEDLDAKLALAYKHICEWCRRPVGNVSDYEVDIICTTADIFIYHDLHSYALNFLEGYQRQKPDARISLRVAECSVRLNRPVTLSEGSEYDLLRLQLGIHRGVDCSALYARLCSTLAIDKSDKYKLVDSIFELSTLSGLAARRSHLLNEPVDSIVSSKRAFRLIQSILKNFILPTRSSGFNLNYKMLMKYKFSKHMLLRYEELLTTLQSYGLGKEFDYFYKEFHSFLGSQPSSYLIAKYGLLSGQLNVFRGRLDEAKKCREIADRIASTQKFRMMEAQAQEATKNYILEAKRDISVSTEGPELITKLDALQQFSFDIEKALSAVDDDPKELVPPSRSHSVERMKLDLAKLKYHIPSNWLVVTLDDYQGGLLRVRRINDDKAMTIDVSVKDLVSRLDRIIESSDHSTKYEVTSKIHSRQQKIDWWNNRKTLDKDLKCLLQCIDDAVVQSGCNLSYRSADLKVFEKSVQKALNQYVPNGAGATGIDSLALLAGASSIKEALEGQLTHAGVNVSELDPQLYRLVGRYAEEVGRPEHVVLVPSGPCVKIPWESMPSLHGMSVSRMPTLAQLQRLLMLSVEEKQVNPDHGFYVLNPAGDLSRTEANFKGKFESMASWHGISGRQPEEAELQDALKRSSLYFYAGHGAGEQYIRSKTIKSSERLPPSLLIGCSSGKLHVEGSLEPYGTVYHYLTGRSPMVLCNLWDVTDKDIDKFTLAAMEKWGLFVDYDSFESLDEGPEPAGLGACVAQSRQVCKLRCLNGAAPVLYGLPMIL